MSEPEPDAAETPPPLSADRLRSAFARMLGRPAGGEAEKPAPANDAVTPERLIEAMLFVGRPNGAAVTAGEMAAVLRDVSPDEVEAIVERLDAALAADGSAWRVERSPDGYRLGLREGLERVADRLNGPVRSTRLSPALLQTLAVVAYRQPITADGVDELRGVPSGGSLKRLGRLGLVRVDPPAEPEQPEVYGTTDRFLRLLSLASVEQLPAVTELDN